ncbi:dipeptidyl aminopeptidase/acylaminoacyl peptidase [Novosphingobium sp. PhB165]|uniref:alpha/beta hydrolase family protein n=1 Tax=Novosphingobium sp. PhB165 TaxID=2485105 RepID=UPI001043ABFC|nr:S9 family peptidase [Novosphingobium sp. PhB165]TCM21390.1 dipeptidyl aminopeptidase/acylaminoacyl peptidase [Novosphingobium sp. PhB165]
MKSRARWAQAALLPAFWPFLAHAAVEPPPLDAYGELPRVEDAAISPNGHNLASVTQVEGDRRISVFDETGAIKFNVSSGKSKVRSIEWADDDTVLLTNSATVPLFGFAAAKYEFYGTVILPLNGGAAGLVFSKTHSIATVTRGSFGIRQIGGKTVGFYGGIALDTRGTDPQFVHGRTTLFAVDLKTNRPRLVANAPAEDHYRDWLIDAAGQVSVLLDIDENSGTWKINAVKGAELARGVDLHGNVSLICFGKDGSTVVYSIDDKEGASHWFEVPLAGGEAHEILDDSKIDRIFVDRANGNLLGYRLDGEKATTVMYDPAKQVALNKIFKAFTGRNPHLVDWTPDFSKVLLNTSGNGDSGTWYLVDVAGRHADPVGNERPAIAAEQVGPISMVQYKAADGLEMDGVLTLPPGREAKNLPIVVLPHGGPAAEDKPVFDWWAQAFASRGYAVFQPNFRGSTGRTDAFRHAGDGQWGRKMQTDISDGLAELVKRGVADPKRACIVGASYGGYAALAGVTLQHGLYRCAVAVAGVADVRLMYDTDLTESGDSRMLRKNLLEELGDPSGFDAISPRRFAAKADAPVLLIHGKDDTVVAYRQSTIMADALKDAGKPYEMVTLPGEDHWLSREETRKRMLSETMRFVQKYNPAD